jgi:N utilization substance protein B
MLTEKRKQMTKAKSTNPIDTTDSKKLGERKNARSEVAAALYAEELDPDFSANFNVAESQKKYAENLMALAREKRGLLEKLIGEHVRGDWTYERINPVIRAILKLAILEMIFVQDVSTATAINEAVNLSKKFADEKAAKFANGILGSIARENEAAESAKEAKETGTTKRGRL